ncbi:Trypsin-like protein [Hapsidospora chrysogenum ATCC 11550]|uniref:Trypsin-like protein n=1 Tax=Hapsidospora chrysogenum (strain ATCC 11550 / CBS 779.69 / DSM 880 / IAM 14645 / JCM 23072 / IMI 49137) TaxID=857340 RepID=A0A086TB41_HAPC1|nr:Trypsin-like protein [Hapsidospora chrysogenum ATCC 11550]
MSLFEENQTIAYATLPEQDSQPSPGSIVSTGGWREVKNGIYDTPSVLNKIDVPVIKHEACEALYAEDGGYKVTDEMFCAGLSGEAAEDTCQGDSGAPVYDGDGDSGRDRLVG